MTKTATRLNLSDAVDDLAPPKPACWPDRTAWLEFLKSAAAVQNHRGEQKVIFTRHGDPEFNTEYDFCGDCLVSRARRMEAEGRCNPNHLKETAKK